MLCYLFWVSDSESCSVISKVKPNSPRWQRHTEFPTCLQCTHATITLQHLTICLIIISVIFLGVMNPRANSTSQAKHSWPLSSHTSSCSSFLFTIISSDSHSSHAFDRHHACPFDNYTLLTSHHRQTHTTHFPSPPRSCPYLLTPSIHVQSSPPPTWQCKEASGHVFYTAIIHYRCFWTILWHTALIVDGSTMSVLIYSKGLIESINKNVEF